MYLQNKIINFSNYYLKFPQYLEIHSESKYAEEAKQLQKDKVLNVNFTNEYSKDYYLLCLKVPVKKS